MPLDRLSGGIKEKLECAKCSTIHQRDARALKRKEKKSEKDDPKPLVFSHLDHISYRKEKKREKNVSLSWFVTFKKKGGK